VADSEGKRQRVKRVRTPTRLQMEATECGAAALATVLEHYGTFVPLATVREQCGVSRDGSKASNILKVAREYGLEARGFRKEPDEVSQMTMPVIVHWNFNHFVVVEGFGKNKVFLNDPASGPVTVTDEEFDHAFTGVVLTFQPTPDWEPRGRRPGLLPSLLGRVAGVRAALAFLVLAGVLLVLPASVAPIFSMIFVDEVLIGGKGYWLPALLLGMALTALLRALITALQKTYLLKLFMKLGVTMSTGFMWHALRLPVSFYLSRMPGDLAGRVRANDAVATTLSGRLAGVLLDLMLVVFYGGFMVYLDPRLTLIGVFTVTIHVVILRATARGRADLGRRLGQHAGKLAGVAAGGLQMIETIKATGSESQFFAQWAGHQAKLVAVQQTAARREQWMLMGTAALSHVNTLLVLSVGALRVMDGHLSVGALVAFQGLMVTFVQPVERLSQVGAALQDLRGDVERLDDVLGHERDEAFAPGAEHTPLADADPRRLAGELAVKSVTFGYLPFAPPLVEELDLHIAPGERVSLVGGTGSGKSTIARLVAGLYRPWSGEILFDGEAREDVPRSALIASVAMVDQDVALFEGTVRENLTLWDDTIPEIDVVQAAKDACIHEDITRLHGGYDARVTEGGQNFSGGQRQRLEIARALVRQPALIVLDEATSALDPETERHVDENLRRRGCSCLIVAHRLSTIRDSDEIIVLEKGRVVQRGSHDELMARGGAYRNLITAG
jgi:NHLM bacteriocin system ABC transporter peptidase/ATP-binding protein